MRYPAGTRTAWARATTLLQWRRMNAQATDGRGAHTEGAMVQVEQVQAIGEAFAAGLRRIRGRCGHGADFQDHAALPFLANRREND